MNDNLRKKIYYLSENGEISYVSTKILGDIYKHEFEDEQDICRLKNKIDQYLLSLDENIFQQVQKILEVKNE